MSAERAPIKVLLRGEQSVVSAIDGRSERCFGRAYSRTRFAAGCDGSIP